MSALELAEHLARRLHTILQHRAPFELCQGWECEQNRAVLTRLAGERQESVA